jgi:hypothetical protein
MVERYSIVDPGPVASLLLTYWRSKCGGRAMPRRSDFDVLDIPPRIWPMLLLIEVNYNPRRLRYRVMGSAVAAMIGKDWTGRYVDEIALQTSAVTELTEETLESGAPTMHVYTYFRDDPEIDQVRRMDFERLLFPFSEDGETVSHILGANVNRILSSDEFENC